MIIYSETWTEKVLHVQKLGLNRYDTFNIQQPWRNRNKDVTGQLQHPEMWTEYVLAVYIQGVEHFLLPL